MNMGALREALSIIEKDEHEIANFTGSIELGFVEQAENCLGLAFPKDYREFLLELGAGNFGATEICGLLKVEFERKTPLSVIWSTKNCRAKGMPEDLVTIGHFELGDPCIRVGSFTEKSPVVSYLLGAPESAQSYEALAPSFGDYLLNAVKEELKFLY